uniref:Uncharacterized protein n=1 Tax=Setaria italica TaxID=4555 RepID=K3ZGG0_SETIT
MPYIKIFREHVYKLNFFTCSRFSCLLLASLGTSSAS